MARRLLFLLFVSVACVACALVLGLEDKPLRPSPDGAGDGSSLDDASSDADAGCTASPEQGCRSCDKHDFCDDFDEDPPFGRWSALPLPKPFIKRDAGIRVDEGGLSPSRSAFTSADTDAGSSYAIVLHELDHAKQRPGQTFGGVRYSAQVRVEAIAFKTPSGPVAGFGSGYVAAILRLLNLTTPAGPAVLVTVNGVYLVVSTDILNATGADTISEIYKGDVLAAAQNNWVRIDLYITERDNAVALGLSSCASVVKGPVSAARLPLGQACLALPAEFGDLSWAKKPIIGVGAGTFGSGTLRVRHDNVMVDFLE